MNAVLQAEKLKKTVLYEAHVKLGGQMVPFGGFEMPVKYSSIIAEHQSVRENAGIFDLSHMGEFEIIGRDALAYLQKMTTNDVSQLKPGKVQYTTMCIETGGIVDDCVLYKMADRYLLVVNASNIEKDLNWLKEHVTGDVSIRDVSDETSLIAVQGPKSRNIILEVFGDKSTIEQLSFYHHTVLGYGSDEILCARTGYTGELGFELYCKNEIAPKLWDHLLETGKSHGLVPVGLGARDTCRLEMKYCLYGNDIDEKTNPLEAGLGWITKFDKGDFVGRESLLQIKENGTEKILIGFEMRERGIPRKDYRFFSNGEPAGIVTSGGYSPSLKNGIGLGFVHVKESKPGARISVEIRYKLLEAEVVKTPFWKLGTYLK